MQLINAIAITRMITRNNFNVESLESDIEFGTAWWFIYAGICCVLVLFAGIMSGLTLGLMSISLVDLEILKRSGSPSEKKQAAAILPVVQKQHQLLVTLLLCNAIAMEALPIYLDKLFNQYVAIVLSVTFVLAFGEVIPQSICTRYGLAVGANFVWLVRILMIICYPIAYPIGKMLDCLLGHHEALFRRAQLKALVSIHSQEAGKGGELTHDETTIISGALDLTEKTAQEAMTPIESTFSLDVNSKLDWEAMGKILARGHSRVPVYSGNPKNIIGLLLVKALLTVRPETETPVSAVSIRRIPRVPADMPLYDILNEFQKGHSHLAAVVKAKPKHTNPSPNIDAGKSEENKGTNGNSDLVAPLLLKPSENTDSIVDVEKISKQINQAKHDFSQASNVPSVMLSSVDDIEEGEVIGIITLEDVFEELLQEEIVDETDEFVDVHKRIRVAAVAAASSVARAPSVRRLTSLKGAGSPKHVPSMKKPSEGVRGLSPFRWLRKARRGKRQKKAQWEDQNRAPVLVPIPPLQGVNNSFPTVLVVDHNGYAVTTNKGEHTLLAPDDFVQPDAILENKKIGAPVLFRGTNEQRWIGILSRFHQSLNNSKKLNVVEAYIAPIVESDEGACEAIEQALIKINEDLAESVLKQKCAVCSPCSISSDESQTREKEPAGTNDNDGNSMNIVPATENSKKECIKFDLLCDERIAKLGPGWPLIRRALSSEDKNRSLPLYGAIVPVSNETLSHHTPPLTNSRCLPIELEGLHENYLSTCRVFKYQELQLATSNFSPGNFIGKGGSSRVYRGCLSDRKELAVKILKHSEEMLKEFILGIEIITSLHHKNIMSLFGFCFEGDNLLLVYDFLPRGSLEENLHGCKKDPRAFGWNERYKGTNAVVYYSTSVLHSVGIAYDVAASALVGAADVLGAATASSLMVESLSNKADHQADGDLSTQMTFDRCFYIYGGPVIHSTFRLRK
ncbi:hypothetical protein Nepgr_030305 [Nepenthes gracilis]|uniref:CNNM transmembrane domain-containing protein n=2 Tax=Magnoliopsida TaxID=3398 RepID=A0AAD3TFI6_NEPGR|nr:hypothetical protein Nepgr_030305 [Nepenthes gracilis]